MKDLLCSTIKSLLCSDGYANKIYKQINTNIKIKYLNYLDSYRFCEICITVISSAWGNPFFQQKPQNVIDMLVSSSVL